MPGKENEIKTRLTLDGEKEFKRGINSINQEMRLSNAQLKEVAATYDLNGNAQDRLTAKSRILREQVAAQNRIVQQYEERMRQAEQATDLSAEGLRGYSIQLTNARTKAKQLEKELADTDRELEELGRDSRRAGDQLENNLGEAAEETESKLQKLARSVNDTLGGMKKLQRVSVAVDIVRGAWDFAENLTNYVQGAVEDGMNRAITAYNNQVAGGNVKQSANVANRYAAIFGDRGAAEEAVNNLLAAGYKDETLEIMSSYVGGLVLALKDTLKVEALSEEIRKYIKSGETGGQLNEAILHIAGLSESDDITQEGIKRQLAAAKTESDRMTALNAYFSNAGLDTYYDNFIKQNEGLVESATALQEFNTALNDLAVTTLPLLTPAIEGTAELFNSLNTPVKEFIRLLTPNDPNADPYEQDRLAIETEKKELYGENWTAQPAGSVYDKYETQPKSIFQAAGDAYLGGLDWLANTGWFGNLVANALGRPAVAGGETLNETAGMKPNAEMSRFVQGYYEQLAEAAAGRNTQIRNRLRQNGIVPAPQIETNYNEGVLEAWDASVNDWTVVEDVESKAAEAEEAAKTGGKNIGSGLVTGLQSQSLRLLAAAAQQRALLERVWEDPIKPTVVVGYQMAGPVNKEFATTTPIIKPATIMLNYRKVGEAIFSYFNGRMGAETEQ